MQMPAKNFLCYRTAIATGCSGIHVKSLLVDAVIGKSPCTQSQLERPALFLLAILSMAMVVSSTTLFNKSHGVCHRHPWVLDAQRQMPSTEIKACDLVSHAVLLHRRRRVTSGIAGNAI